MKSVDVCAHHGGHTPPVSSTGTLFAVVAAQHCLLFMLCSSRFFPHAVVLHTISSWSISTCLVLLHAIDMHSIDNLSCLGPAAWCSQIGSHSPLW